MLKLTVVNAFDAKGAGIWEGWKVLPANGRKPTFVCLCGEESDEDENEEYAFKYRVLLHEGDFFFRAKEVPGYWSYGVYAVVNGKLCEVHSVTKGEVGDLAMFARSLVYDGLFDDFVGFTRETGRFIEHVGRDLFYEEFYKFR